jgi:hypothetical protein
MWVTHKVSCSVFLSNQLAAETTLHGYPSNQVLQGMMTLADLFMLQDHYAEAEKMLQQAELMAWKLLGQKHPHVAAILHNISLV